MTSARDWAERAVTMEDSDGQANTVLSHVYLLERRFDEALKTGHDAIFNRPNCTHANAFYANVLHYCGEQEKALYYIKWAIRFSPIHPPLFKNILAAACRGTGDLDAAITAAQAGSLQNPDDLISRMLMASVYIKMQKTDLAENQAHEINKIDPAFSLIAFAKRQPYKNDDYLNSFISDLKLAGLTD